MAVFRRHLLAQTLRRAVLSIPVLVVPLLGARRPEIPKREYASRTVKNYNRRRRERSAGRGNGLEKNSVGQEKDEGRERERERERVALRDR